MCSHSRDLACVWLTVPEAAAFLKVDKSTLYRYIQLGKLEVNRPGGYVIRICLEELNMFGAVKKE